MVSYINLTFKIHVKFKLFAVINNTKKKQKINLRIKLLNFQN